MKKLIILLCFLATPAIAAVKRCVKLDPATTTCRPTNPTKGRADWTANCTTNDGTTIPVQGIATCGYAVSSDSRYANTSVSLGYPKANLTTISGWNASDVVYVHDAATTVFPPIAACWCRIISPIVSSWIQTNGASDNTIEPETTEYAPHKCLYDCSHMCANRIGTFYEALLGSAAKSGSDTECPPGYIGIDEPVLTLEETCPRTDSNGYQYKYSIGTPKSCLDANPSSDCILYGEANTVYTDNAGTFEFSSTCVMQ